MAVVPWVYDDGWRAAEWGFRRCTICLEDEATAAFELVYDGKSTGWMGVCDACQSEEQGIAPYWWNEAIAGRELQ
jgi:protein-arginine kinase activator protein McsA